MSFVWDSNVSIVFDIGTMSFMDLDTVIQRDQSGIDKSVLWWNSACPEVCASDEAHSVQGLIPVLEDVDSPRYIPVFFEMADVTDPTRHEFRRALDVISARLNDKLVGAPPLNRQIEVKHGMVIVNDDGDEFIFVKYQEALHLRRLSECEESEVPVTVTNTGSSIIISRNEDTSFVVMEDGKQI